MLRLFQVSFKKQSFNQGFEMEPMPKIKEKFALSKLQEILSSLSLKFFKSKNICNHENFSSDI